MPVLFSIYQEPFLVPPYQFLKASVIFVVAAMLLLSRSMLAILFATVAVIPAASARNVAFANALKKVLDDIIDSWADNERAKMPELGAPSWKQKVENKHMCASCHGTADALTFSQLVCNILYSIKHFYLDIMKGE